MTLFLPLDIPPIPKRLELVEVLVLVKEKRPQEVIKGKNQDLAWL